MKVAKWATMLVSGATLATMSLGGSALADNNYRDNDHGRYDSNNYNYVLHARRPSLDQFLRQVDPDDYRWIGHHWVRVRWDRDDARYVRLYFQIFGNDRNQYWNGHGWNWNGNDWDRNGSWNGHNNYNND